MLALWNQQLHMGALLVHFKVHSTSLALSMQGSGGSLPGEEELLRARHHGQVWKPLQHSETPALLLPVRLLHCDWTCVLHFRFHLSVAPSDLLLLALLAIQVWRFYKGTCAIAASEKVSATTAAPPESFVPTAAAAQEAITFACAIAVPNQAVTVSYSSQRLAQVSHQWIKAVQLPLGAEWGAMVAHDCAQRFQLRRIYG